MKKLSVLVICLFLFACQNDPRVIKRDGQPDISLINQDDSEMTNAIKLANQTLGQFDLALQTKDTTLKELALKVRFNTPEGGGEHMWVSDITTKGNQYYGVVANVPNSTLEVKAGDNIMIQKAQISDWKYIQNGKLKGGYTIRVMRNQLSEADKKLFDQQLWYDLD